MNRVHYSPSFDFDAWTTLARQDPQAFEKKRSRVIEAAILGAPAKQQPQLRRTQWKLDQIRRSSATPLAACLRMQRMLWQRIEGENGLLDCLQQPAAVIRRRSQARAGEWPSITQSSPTSFICAKSFISRIYTVADKICSRSLPA